MVSLSYTQRAYSETPSNAAHEMSTPVELAEVVTFFGPGGVCGWQTAETAVDHYILEGSVTLMKPFDG